MRINNDRQFNIAASQQGFWPTHQTSQPIQRRSRHTRRLTAKLVIFILLVVVATPIITTTLFN